MSEETSLNMTMVETTHLFLNGDIYIVVIYEEIPVWL